MQSTKFCTLHFITYPDVVYKVAIAAIFIQTRGVQSVFSQEIVITPRTIINLHQITEWKEAGRLFKSKKWDADFGIATRLMFMDLKGDNRVQKCSIFSKCRD